MNYVVEYEREDGRIDLEDYGTDYAKACRVARNLSEPFGMMVYVVALDHTDARVGHVLYVRGVRSDVEGRIR